MYPDTTDDEALAQGRPRHKSHMVSTEQLRTWKPSAQSDALKPQSQSRANVGRRTGTGRGSKASKSEGDEEVPSSIRRQQMHRSRTAHLRLEEGICEEGESEEEETKKRRLRSRRVCSLAISAMLIIGAAGSAAVLWFGALGGLLVPRISPSRPQRVILTPQRVLHLELAGSEVRSRFVLDTELHDWESFEQGCKERLNIPAISRVTLASSGEDILSVSDMIHGDSLLVHPAEG